MSTHEQITNNPTSAVRNTGGRNGPQGLEEPISDEILREVCDKNYHQLLPLIAEKMQKEKEQKDKLNAVKARLIYGEESGIKIRGREESHYSESKTPTARTEPRRRHGERYSRSPSPHASVFKRLKKNRSPSPQPRPRKEGGVFNRLGRKEPVTSARSDSRRQSPQAKRTEVETRRRQQRQTPSHATSQYSDISRGLGCPAMSKHTTEAEIRKITVKFIISRNPQKNRRVGQCRLTLMENYLQQTKHIKDPVEIHHIKQRDGESTEDFMERYKAEVLDVEGEVAALSHGRRKASSSWKPSEGGDKPTFKKGFKNKQRPNHNGTSWHAHDYPELHSPRRAMSFSRPLSEERRGRIPPMNIEVRNGGRTHLCIVRQKKRGQAPKEIRHPRRSGKVSGRCNNEGGYEHPKQTKGPQSKGQYMADFIVERPEEESPDELIAELEVLPEPWTLFTDGSSCVDGSGAELQEKSINKEEILDIVEEEGNTWMTPIQEYLKKEILPEDKKKARAVTMHSGPRSVVAKVIQTGYYWPTMHMDARNLIRECNDCQIHRPVPRNPHTELDHSITSPWPFHKWGIDIAGPFPKGPGKVKFLIVAIDYFTKWIEAKAVATITGSQEENTMGQLVCRFCDYRGRFITDPGNSSVHQFQRVGVDKLRRNKGKADERSRDLIEELPHVLWAHRTMIKSSNEETPFSLTYGTEAVIPAEIGMPTLRTT
ncbi:reverse transcriptase domain-containing protein [Tanacetum coccineum]